MNKKEIESRQDVFILISSFYDKIKNDTVIGHFFLNAISEEEWDIHIEHLTDFWETNLFFTRKFKGNPIQVHQNVDQKSNYSIQQKHFGRWLQLWFTTIDELFIGEKANQAKERARNIASMLFFKLYAHKPKK